MKNTYIIIDRDDSTFEGEFKSLKETKAWLEEHLDEYDSGTKFSVFKVDEEYSLLNTVAIVNENGKEVSL